MRKRIKVRGYDKVQVTRKVTRLCLDKGWTPITRIMPEDSGMHHSTVGYFCFLEHEENKPSKGWSRVWA